MFAVVEISGAQYRVEPEQVIKVAKLEAAEGEQVTLDRVLLVESGDDVRVGAPVVDGASVSAEVVAHGRGKKISAGRFLRRKDHRRKWGHRQDYTELRIGSIQG